jgi:hypothetical protein
MKQTPIIERLNRIEEQQYEQIVSSNYLCYLAI